MVKAVSVGNQQKQRQVGCLDAKFGPKFQHLCLISTPLFQVFAHIDHATEIHLWHSDSGEGQGEPQD